MANHLPAKSFSHLGSDNSREQLNNPMNVNGLLSQQFARRTPYDDNFVPGSVDGVQISPAPQQRVVLPPPTHGNANEFNQHNKVYPGHPGQMASMQQMEELGSPALTTTTAMSATQQAEMGLIPPGNSRAALDRGIPGALAMGGMNTSLGGTRPMSGRG